MLYFFNSAFSVNLEDVENLVTKQDKVKVLGLWDACY